MRYKTISISVLLFLPIMSFNAQEKQNENIIGIDVLDLPSTTLTLKYQFFNSLRYSFNVKSGFTVYYANNIDLDIEHSLFLTGIETAFGYTIRVQKELQFDFALQLTKLFNDNGDLFGHENYIPCAGFHAYNTGDEIFHRFYLNICYEYDYLNLGNIIYYT